MSTKLKFTGLAHVRSFVKGDFTKHGVGEAHAVRFNVDNNFVAEVTSDMAEYLLANYGEEFREATDQDEKEQDMSRVGTPARAIAAPAEDDEPDDDASLGEVSPGAVSDTSGAGGTAGRGSTGRGRSRA